MSTSYTEATTFRPRNGVSAECYWRIRGWCEKNGFSFSDVLNALLIPVAYYLENHSQVDRARSKATVTLNIGDVDILHVFNGKCYPLATEKTTENKNTLTLEDIQVRVDYWVKRNVSTPTHYDLLLLATNPHAQEKLSNRKSGRRIAT